MGGFHWKNKGSLATKNRKFSLLLNGPKCWNIQKKKNISMTFVLFFSFSLKPSITRKALRYNLAERKPMRGLTCLSVVKV